MAHHPKLAPLYERLHEQAERGEDCTAALQAIINRAQKLGLPGSIDGRA